MATAPKTPRRLLRGLSDLVARFAAGSERDYFVENLSLFVSAGVDIVTALEAIEEEMHSREMRRVLALVRENLEAGVPLSEALEQTHLFPPHALSLVKIGEESGNLSRNLKVVATEAAKERTFRAKVRSAVMYPAFVLVVTFVVGLSIAWFILPKLAAVFSTLHLHLPFVTRVLIGLGAFLGRYGAIAVPLSLLALLALGYFVFSFAPTKFIGQYLVFNLPGIGRLLAEVELARMSYLMSSLLEAGLPVVPALDSIANSSEVPRYRAFYRYLRDQVLEGRSFEESITRYPDSKRIIPAPMQQLIFSGERSGNLPEMFAEINRRYEEKTDTTTKDLAVVLEPILLVIVALGVFTVALGVISPIYSLVGGLGGSAEQNAPVPPPSPSAPSVNATIYILDTGTGYLNVRAAASAGSAIVARVKPGERYGYQALENGWYEITVEGVTGWVRGDYATTSPP